MANKKVSQLVSKPSVLVTDLFPIADPTTGQLYKTTISDLGTAIGSGVSSVNTLVGAVVLDTDDIQELASPTNRWFTDTRARAALSATSPLAYNSGTGVFSIPQATGSQNGFLSSTDWTTFNAKQQALSGTGFVKISGTTISYDNSTYLTTSAAASTYLALAGGTLTGALNGTSATFTGDLTISSANPRLYFTDTDNNPDYFISNTDGTFTVYDVTNSTSRFTIGTTGNGTFGGNLTVGQIIRSGGTSSQFLKADGSVDSSTYVPTSRTLTINGTALDLSADRSWTIASYSLPTATDTVLGGVKIGSGVTITSGVISVSTNYQAPLSGTGFVKISGSTISYDNSTYLTTSSASSTYLPLAGGTLTGALNGTSALFSGAVRANNPAEGATGEGLIAGQSFKIDGTGTSQKAVMYLVSNVLSDTYASGLTAQFANFAGDKGFGFNLNTSGGYELYVKNSTWNKALTIANTGAATFSNKVTTTGPANDWGLVVNGSTTLGQSYGANIIAGSNSSDVAFLISNYVGGDILRVLGTGAATFSSSVDIAQSATVRGFTGTTGAGMFMAYGSAGAGIGSIFSYNYGTSTYGPTILDGSYVAFYNSGSERMRITGGNVGIGTTAPNSASVDRALTISGTSNSILEINYGATRGAYLYSNSINTVLSSVQATPLLFNTSDTERMRITSGGQVQIKQAADTHADGLSIFNISGNSWNYVNGGDNNLYLGYNGISKGVFAYVTGTYTALSDKNKKKDFEVSNIGLNEVMLLKPTLYRMKSDESEGQKELGFIAQDVKSVIPNAYVESGDFIGLNFNPIVAALTKAVQELKAELDTLKNK